jgi:hypothetical protein
MYKVVGTVAQAEQDISDGAPRVPTLANPRSSMAGSMEVVEVPRYERNKEVRQLKCLVVYE